jgi:hypothetical protein
VALTAIFNITLRSQTHNGPFALDRDGRFLAQLETSLGSLFFALELNPDVA